MKTCCDELIELIALAVIVLTLACGWNWRPAPPERARDVWRETVSERTAFRF